MMLKLGQEFSGVNIGFIIFENGLTLEIVKNFKRFLFKKQNLYCVISYNIIQWL